jgi:hypothetical protein
VGGASGGACRCCWFARIHLARGEVALEDFDELALELPI